MTFVRRLLFATTRLIDRLRNGVLHIAAGTMRLRDLRATVAQSWGDFNHSDAEIRAGLMPWERSVVGRFISHGSRVLVVGSGTGRDLLALAEMGCDMTGVEPSARAASRARQFLAAHHVNATLIDGFFEDVDVPGCFDAIVFSYFCYSYIPGSARRVGLLSKARASLAPGGRVIVSFLFRQNPPRGRAIAIARCAGAVSGSDWRMEPGDALEHGRISPPTVNFEHIFGPGEVEIEAGRAGLAVAARGGDPHEEPWVVLVPR